MGGEVGEVGGRLMMEAMFCVKYPVFTPHQTFVSSGNNMTQPSPELVLAPLSCPSAVLLLLFQPSTLMLKETSGVPPTKTLCY